MGANGLAQAINFEVPPHEGIDGVVFPYQLPAPLADCVRSEVARPWCQQYSRRSACYQTGGPRQRWPQRARLSQAELSPATADFMR